MLPFSVDPNKDTMCDVIRRWAEVQPEAPALLRVGAPSITYGGLIVFMDGFKSDLAASGFASGARIGLVHSGGADMVSLLLGIMELGAVAPINPTLKTAEFKAQFEIRRLDGLVVEAGLETAAREAARDCNIPVYEAAAGSVGQIAHDLKKAGDQPAVEQLTDPDIILVTSGTTSVAKSVTMSRARTLNMFTGRARFFDFTPADRCLVMRPLFYAAGLMNTLLTMYSGGSVAVIDRLEATNFLRHLETFQPTWYDASPAFHKIIIGMVQGLSAPPSPPRLRFIRISTGRLEDEIAFGLEHFFGVPLIDGYSSTETGTIASNPPSLAARKRGTVGIPIDGEFRIRGEDGRFLGPGMKGEIVAKGPAVFEGYEKDPEANAEAFVEGWFRTGDEGAVDEDGYLTLTGRFKEMISRGGEKVNPVEVDAALLGHPDVVEAATFPVAHATLGEEIAAAVVLRADANPTKGELTRYLLDHLTGFKVPRRLVFIDAIPKGDSDKVQRNKLADALGLAGIGAAVRGADAGREPTALEARLQTIWATVLKLDHVGLNDNFFLLGGDSLQAVDLFFEIEKALRRRLPVACLFESGTVAEMAELIEKGEAPGCMVPIQPKGTRPPFFCIHGNGGEVIGFYNLAKHLGIDQPFYGIQSVGWDGSVSPFTRSEDMAAHYLAEMRKVQPRGPYYLGGYSFGGRIAVYMANMLKAEGEEVVLLALLDPHALMGPRLVSLGEWMALYGASRGTAWLSRAGQFYWEHISQTYNAAYDRLRRAFLFSIWDHYRRSGKTLPHWLRRPDRANRLVRLEQGHMLTFEGDAVYFKAEIGRSMAARPNIHKGWQKLIKGRLDVVPVPGRHDQIIQEPYAETLARELGHALEKAQGAGP
jgi:acyl-CoA synthetase (AMP-forming)/AMP-acid ligase II/thioesterase domain-containing protein/acyl carrier protein